MSLVELIEAGIIRICVGRKPRATTPPTVTDSSCFIVGKILAEVGEESPDEGESVVLTESELFRHVYTIGSSGSGKSTFLTRLFDAEVEACR